MLFLIFLRSAGLRTVLELRVLTPIRDCLKASLSIKNGFRILRECTKPTPFRTKNQIAIYRSDDGHVSLSVQLNQETVWLTQAQMVELV